MYDIVLAVLGLFFIVAFFVAVSRLYHIKNHLQAISVTSDRIYVASSLMLLQQVDKIEHGSCPACNRRMVLGLPACPFCNQKLDWSNWVVAKTDDTTLLPRQEFIDTVFRIAKELGYDVERSSRTGLDQIDFGNKKLHARHLGELYPEIMEPNANVSDLIEKVAKGRPCTHKPMKTIIETIHLQFEKSTPVSSAP